MSVKIREQILSIKPYVPGKPISEVEKELGLTDVIKLASNENPLGPSPEAISALQLLAQEAHIYPDGNCTYLKEVLAHKLQVGMDQLIVGNGSDEILKFIGEAYLAEGDEVIMADPTFSEYQYVTRLMGGVEKPIPLKNYTHDLVAMASAITDQTKIIFVCNPNNPTGTIVKEDEFGRFLTDVPDDVLVVVDEAYYEYVSSRDYPESLPWVAQGKNIIVTRTFSKIHGLAGLRIGYGIAKPEIITNLSRVKEPFNVNSLAQAGAKASLADTNHVKKSIELNQAGKTYLYQQFTELNLEYIPTETNFILVDVQRDSREVFGELLAKGVIIRTGDIFGLPTFIRVTIGTKEENSRFVGALKEVLLGENRN